MEKISVVIPVYKVERYLHNCIDSIINQTYKNLEIILVNDGSPDNCGNICDEYAKKDKRIIVIHKENAGVSAARNTGFNIATGEYITFVDSDDWLSLETLEVAHKQATKNMAELVFWNLIFEYQNRSKKAKSIFVKDKIFNDDECRNLQIMAITKDDNFCTSWSKLIKMSYLKMNDIIHNELIHYCEDLYFAAQICENLKKAVFINDYYYHYRSNAESVVNNLYNEKIISNIIFAIKTIYEMVHKSKNKDLLLNALYKRILYIIIATAVSGYFHPNNNDKYKIKKIKFNEFISEPIITEVLKKVDIKKISFERKIILFLIKNNIYFIIPVLSRIRRLQKK